MKPAKYITFRGAKYVLAEPMDSSPVDTATKDLTLVFDILAMLSESFGMESAAAEFRNASGDEDLLYNILSNASSFQHEAKIAEALFRTFKSLNLLSVQIHESRPRGEPETGHMY